MGAPDARALQGHRSALQLLQRFLSMEKKLRLGFLASGRGSNLQAILQACRDGRLRAVPAVVISNNADSGALILAGREALPACHLSGKTHPDPAALDEAIAAALPK